MLIDIISKFPGLPAVSTFLSALQTLEKCIPEPAKDYVIDQAVAYLQSLKSKQ